LEEIQRKIPHPLGAGVCGNVRYDERVEHLTLLGSFREWWKQSVALHGTAGAFRNFCVEFWGFLRDSTPEQRRRRYGDVEYDWHHRVDTTSATVGWRERLLGVFHSPYQATEPALFQEILAALRIDFAEFVFVDLGSGKGRTLLMASEYPFQKIMGVERLPGLNQIAQENLRKYSSPNQKCHTLESICGDAREFDFPAEPIVLYLFNPVPESGLARVIGNLERSLTANPRRTFVLYHNPEHEEILARSPKLRRACGTHQYAIYEGQSERA
jgi:SAM-dependent methyltransferase